MNLELAKNTNIFWYCTVYKRGRKSSKMNSIDYEEPSTLLS